MDRFYQSTTKRFSFLAFCARHKPMSNRSTVNRTYILNRQETDISLMFPFLPVSRNYITLIEPRSKLFTFDVVLSFGEILDVAFQHETTFNTSQSESNLFSCQECYEPVNANIFN